MKNQTFYLVKYKSGIEVHRLNSKIFPDNTNNMNNYDDYLFAFADPSRMESNPGWPLRNYIMFLLYNW